MRDYSKPPYSIYEIGAEVKRIGEILNITCNLTYSPQLKSLGAYSMPILSEDMVRIDLRMKYLCLLYIA